jgi:L-lactate dehydrogenase (cytochrome)
MRRIVIKDELETAMRLVGITDLSQVHPGLVNSGEVDHLVPAGEQHPYARWSPRRSTGVKAKL